MDPRAELAWCLTGPDLLAPSPLPLAGLTAWLQAQPDAAIHAHMATLPRQLGRRFERHWAWAMARQPDWTLHAADLPIVVAGRTLGAPDLLMAHQGTQAHQTAMRRAGVVWHELAVKFYLCRPGADGRRTTSWVGPGGNDRLDRKLDRLRTHQLPLLKTPEARAWLSDHGLPEPDRVIAMLKGILFSHWRDEPVGPGPTPPAGRWCRLSELPQALESASLLHRGMWLGDTSDATHCTGDSLLRAAEAQVGLLGYTQLIDQSRRWFVVPDEWSL